MVFHGPQQNTDQGHDAVLILFQLAQHHPRALRRLIDGSNKPRDA